MIELVGRTVIDDYMLRRPMDKKEHERLIKSGIVHSFADKLMEDEKFQLNTVERESIDPFRMGGTVYETRMTLLTPEEAREYEELKQLKFHLKQVTFHEPNNWMK